MKRSVLDRIASKVAERGWETLPTDTLHTTRDVYFTERDTVVKIPQEPFTVHTNMKEIEAWNMLQDSSLLAPIVDYHPKGYWIEMVECDAFDYEEKTARQTYKQKLRRQPFSIDDLHPANLGTLNGEIVAIDYAQIDLPDPETLK